MPSVEVQLCVDEGWRRHGAGIDVTKPERHKQSFRSTANVSHQAKDGKPRGRPHETRAPILRLCLLLSPSLLERIDCKSFYVAEHGGKNLSRNQEHVTTNVNKI